MTEGDGGEPGPAAQRESSADTAEYDHPSGIVAFDNTGTLSRVEIEVLAVREDDRFTAPVPDVDPAARTALVGLAVDALDAFEADDALGTVLRRAAVPVRVVLSNTETSDEEAFEAAAAEDAVPARRVVEAVGRLRERLAAAGDPGDAAVAVQLVVDLDGGTVQRVIAYTTLPRPGSAGVVDAARARGYEPHIVSGDDPAILARVAAHTGVPEGHVHPHQSAADKAATVERLQERTDGPVVMVGDYVNDRLAFAAADRAVLVTHDGTADPELAGLVDTVAAAFDDVPAALPPVRPD